MKDPTYDREVIDSDLITRIAFRMSERVNDGAPIGWSACIPGAVLLLDLIADGLDEDDVLDKWERDYWDTRADHQSKLN